MNLEVHQIARAPRDKVFAAYSDFESWPKWSGVDSVKVLSTEGDSVRVRTELLRGGVRRVSDSLLTVNPPGLVELDDETRVTKRKRTVTFEEVPEGTRVTARLEVTVKGLWSALLVPRGGEETEASAQARLAAFVKYVEGLP